MRSKWNYSQSLMHTRELITWVARDIYVCICKGHVSHCSSLSVWQLVNYAKWPNGKTDRTRGSCAEIAGMISLKLAINLCLTLLILGNF